MKYLTKLNVGFALLIFYMMSALYVGFWAYIVGIPSYILLAPELWAAMVAMADDFNAMMGIDPPHKK